MIRRPDLHTGVGERNLLGNIQTNQNRGNRFYAAGINRRASVICLHIEALDQVHDLLFRCKVITAHQNVAVNGMIQFIQRGG